MNHITNDFAAILKTLADETRFRIIDLRPSRVFCVGALAGHLHISEAGCWSGSAGQLNRAHRGERRFMKREQNICRLFDFHHDIV